MNDLDRIKEIEQAFGFSLNRVDLKKLFKEKSVEVNVETGARNYDIENPFEEKSFEVNFETNLRNYSDETAIRNYSIDASGFVTGLAIDFSPHFLINYLSDFCKLEKLKLKNSFLRDYSFLKELKSLISLDLSSNQISDYSFLEELKSLTSLNISDTTISDGSFLKELKSLSSLSIGGTQISDYSFLEELKSLNSLYLSGNQIVDGSFLKDLKSLTSLYLRSAQINDGSFLKELRSLTSLDLSFNQISDGSFLKELKVLTSLNLSGNQFAEVSNLKELKSLTSLYLRSNRIIDTSFLKELKSLTSLNLSLNQISDGSFLMELRSLTSLDLDGNEKINLPKNLINEPYSPLDIRGIEAIRRYYEQLEAQGLDYIYEAKVLIVGEPGAGKTTLRRKLKDHDYLPQKATKKEKESTVGVDIVTLEFAYNENPEINFTANLWDFGGQKIQYILHQYFFTQRSLYVLLADDRKQLTNFHYWFEIIGTLGKDCPVLVVLNEINHQSVTNFDISEYKREFGNSLRSISEKEVDFSKTDKRFKSLDEEIKDKLCNLDHIGKPLPAQWIPIREELGIIKEQKAYIEIDEYYEICRKHKVTDKDYQKDILHYFHDLGIALNYETDKNLQDILILSPNWVIDALYVVLKDKSVKDNYGKFCEEDVFKLWENKYNRKDCKTLLRLMEKGKFEVAYQIGKTNDYIVPALLPSITPEYVFDRENALQIFFQYKFMPPGILSRLVVRLHENIVGQNEIQIVWEKGMLLGYKESTAEVIESEYLKQIQIKVTGANPIHNKELVTIIRNEIQKIHKDWFDNRLIFDEFVPCICKKCKENKENRKFYILKTLEEKIARGKTTIECDQSDKDVNVRELLEGVYVESKSGYFKEILKYSPSENRDTIYHIDNSITISDGKQNTIVQGSRNVGPTRNINSHLDEKLERMLINLYETQKRDMEALAQEIVDYFSERMDKLNPETKADFEAAKNGEWRMKFKLAVPLIKYLGINFETEREIKADEVISGIRKMLHGKEEEVISILNAEPAREKKFLT